MLEQPLISAVVSDASEAKVTVRAAPNRPGVAARLFRELSSRSVVVDMINKSSSTNGTADISFTVPRDDLAIASEVVDRLQPEIAAQDVVYQPRVATVSVVGAGLRSHVGVSATVFEILAKAGIDFQMISTSAVRITLALEEEVVDGAVAALSDAFDVAETTRPSPA